MKIVILDGYSANPGDLSWEPLKELGTLVVYDRTAPGEVVERAQDAEVVLTNKVQMTSEVIKQLPCLKYIGELATGFNNIDIVAAREQGVVVCNIPAYSTASVAQMVFAHILNITNRIGHYAELNRNGRIPTSSIGTRRSMSWLARPSVSLVWGISDGRWPSSPATLAWTSSP